MKITRPNVRIAEAKVRIARRKLVEAKKELKGLNESVSTSELFPSEKVERIVKKILKGYADYFDDDWDSESEILENKPEWEDVISVDRDSPDYYLTCAIAESLSKNLKKIQDFKKAFKQYDIKCNATVKGKRISESEELNPIGGSVCMAVYELFSDYMESGMSAADAFRRALRDAKVEFEGDVDAAAFFNQIRARCRTIRDFNVLAAQYNVCDWGSEEDRALFMDDAEYEDYLNSRI